MARHSSGLAFDAATTRSETTVRGRALRIAIPLFVAKGHRTFASYAPGPKRSGKQPDVGKVRTCRTNARNGRPLRGTHAPSPFPVVLGPAVAGASFPTVRGTQDVSVFDLSAHNYIVFLSFFPHRRHCESDAANSRRPGALLCVVRKAGVCRPMAPVCRQSLRENRTVPVRARRVRVFYSMQLVSSRMCGAGSMRRLPAAAGTSTVSPA